MTLVGSTLTFTSAYNGNPIVFTVAAVNDDAIEGNETIIATLSKPTIAEGTASIGTASDTVTITEIDEAISFSIAVSPDSISEEAAGVATFTLSVAGFPLNAGNTATVDLAASGTATGGDYTPALLTSLAAALPAGVTLVGSTLTFTSAYNGNPIVFSVAAINDDEIEGNETIVATLSAATIAEGTASIGNASAPVTITEIDQAISFSIAASPDSISEEAAGVATFTLSVTGFPLNAGNTATVDLAASGTATGGDYTPALLTSLAAALPAGVTLVGSTLTFTSAYSGNPIVFTVAAVNDGAIEGPETIVATLSTPTIVEGTASIGTASDTVTITEIDQAISFGIAASPDSISEEAAGVATFTLSVTGFPLNAGNTATVDLAASGTATGGDYTPALLTSLAAALPVGVTLVGSTLTFTSAYSGNPIVFTVAAVNDGAIEGNETVIATLSNQTIVEGTASIGTASDTVTITEIDQAISFSIAASPDSISEEAAGVATFTLSVTGFPLNAGNTATVDLAASGTAAGGDYTPALLTSLAAALPAGVTLVGTTLTFTSAYSGNPIVFTVAAVNDDTIEGNETIIATLSAPTIVEGTASIGTASDTVTITEIDEAISFSVAASPDSISEEAAGVATFTLSVTGFPLNTGNTATVNLAASGTATGGDYTPALLTSLAAALPAGVTLVGTTLTFTSTYSGDPIVFTVAAVNDDAIEGNETIVATLSTPTIVEGTASIGTASDTVTITEIDQAISFSISASPDSISEEAAGVATFTLSVTGFPLNAGNTATVNLAASGTATGGDYTPALLTSLAAALPTGVTLVGTTLTFTSAYNGNPIVFTVAAVNDDAIEGPETIIATLSTPTIAEGTASIGTASDTVTITEIDEAISFSINASPDSISEEAGGVATFTLSVTGFPLNAGNTATVNLAASGTATGGDYTPSLLSSLAAALPAGVTLVGSTLTFTSAYNGNPIVFSVTVVDDSLVEGSETIVATLSSATIAEGTASIGTASDTVTITEVETVLVVGSNKNDDETAPASNTDYDHVVPNGPAGTHGDLNGTSGVDIIVGDPGAQGTVQPGDTANIVFVLDTSGSMDATISFDGGNTTRIQALQAAVNQAIDDLAGSDAGNIRIHIVQFNDAGGPGVTFDLITNGVVNTSQVSAAHDLVNGLDDTFDGSTNYEFPLQQVQQWVQGNSVTYSVNGNESFDGNTSGSSDTTYLLSSFGTKVAVVSAWIGSNQENVTGTSAGWGVAGDDNLDPTEILRFDFGAENDFDLGGSFDPSPNTGSTGFGTQFDQFQGPPIEFAEFEFSNFGGGDQVQYVVHYTDSTVGPATTVSSDGDITLGTNGKTIAFVEFTSISGSGPRISLQNITVDYDGPLPSSDLNKVIFISDGEPNAGGTFTDEVTAIESAFGPIEAVGIAVAAGISIPSTPLRASPQTARRRPTSRQPRIWKQ